MAVKSKLTVHADKELSDWLEGLEMEGKSKERVVLAILHAAMIESRLPLV